MDNVINDKYRIQLEILTPLSIGAGSETEWAKGVDYIISNNKLYHLDLRKMKEIGIDINKLSSYWAERNEESVKHIIGPNLSKVSDRIMDIPCKTFNNIKTFIVNQLTQNPIIPGSSIKGAVRSVLFSYLRDQEKKESDVFGNAIDGTDFMRFIRFSDFEFEQTALVNTKIYNLFGSGNNWQGGWKHNFRNGTSTDFSPTGFNTIYECLMPSSEALGTFMLSEELFKLLIQYGPKQPCFYKKKELFSHNGKDDYGEYETSPIENLFYQINSHTFDYLKRELHFFTKFNQGEFCDRIIDSIKQLMNQVNNCIENGDSCILKMAAGSGFHSITGDWQHNDYSDTGYWEKGKDKGKLKYKSRKIAINGKQFTLMGFVKLSK